jgi:hypothetical protein
MDRSPQWAKNAANAAKKRAMNRTKRNQNRVNNYLSTGRNGEYEVVPRSVMNKEGRKYKFFHGRNWWKDPEQISGPPMPSAWLPESGYGAERERERPYYTMERPEQEFGVYNAETGETSYGGSRKTRSRNTRRKSRNRKTRRNRR